MCINKMEMEKKMEEIKSLKRLKEEVEANISALEMEVIGYLVENADDLTVTDKKTGKEKLQYIGNIFKATYSEQSRETVDAKKVKDMLTAEEYCAVSKTSTYNVLRIS